MRRYIYLLTLLLLCPPLSAAKADDNVPKADILDVVFNSDGTAVDISPMQNEVQVIGQSAIEVYFNETYKMNIPRFTNPWSGTATHYYKVDYENNEAFKSALADGHTLETLVKADYSGSLPDKECKPFSSHQTGGTGLMLCKTGKSVNGGNEFTFLPYIGESYRYTVSGVTPQPKIFYHVVGVWNKEEGKTYIYVDGELKGTAEVEGEFKFPTAKSGWFGIGCDPSGNKGNTSWTGEVAIARIYNDPLTADQVAALYKQVDVGVDYSQMLQNTIDSIVSIDQKYAIGNDPGCYTQEVFDKYNAAYLDVFQKAQNAAYNGVNKEEYETLRSQLLNAYNELQTQYNPLAEGYYYIVSKQAAFASLQPDVQKAMYAKADSRLYWGNLDMQKAMYAFHLRKTDDGNFTIQNVATKEYIRCVTDETGHHTDASSFQVELSKEPDASYEQFVRFLGVGQFNIGNTGNSRPYNADGNQSGYGISGRVTTWNGALNSESAWAFSRITDDALIKEFEENGAKQVMADRLQDAITAARTSSAKAYDYTKLITDAGQISSNAQSTTNGSTYAGLIDGQSVTIFHSVWDGTFATPQVEGLGWHNLQFNIGRPVSKIKFHFDGRDNSDGYHDNPTHITLYATNDDNLGASTAAADSTMWTEIVDMGQKEYGFPGDQNLVSYDSPEIDLKGSYKYLRFVVKHVSTQETKRANKFATPSVTGVTFNLSEFQIYDAVPAATSEYYKVPGMKEACDALDALISAAQEKMTNLTVTEEDIRAIEEQAGKIEALYVDREFFDNQLATLLQRADGLYNEVRGTSVPLVLNASQLSTNSVSSSDYGSLEHLIDGQIDQKHNFHSVWITDPMKNANITPEEWEAAMASAGKTFVGHGYHNLQVKLNEPQSKFWFEYYSRTGDSYIDNPNDIEIYATNDDELGATPDQADIDKWTRITELTEGFPGVVAGVRYVSPEIDLGDSYKYIRFVIKNTAMVGTVSNRTFANPEVTGITWSIGEMQLYSGLSPERCQYNYIAGMKEACDAMKALYDEGSKMEKLQMVNSEFNDKFSAAIEAVVALYADTTELVQLYKEKKLYGANTIVDATEIGCLNSEENLVAYNEAIDAARASVDSKKPEKASIAKAVEDIKVAYTTLMGNINKVETGKWYYIVSKSNLAYCADKAIYMKTANNGSTISFGLYTADDGATYTENPYAMWRIVPIEGTSYYSIQNLGTAHNFGPSLGKGTDYKVLVQNEPSPYRIDYIGKGQIQMVSINDDNKEGHQIHAQEDGSVIVPWSTGLDGASCWTFKEVDAGSIAAAFPVKENSIRIQTLPYDVPAGVTSIMNLNDGIQTYAVKNLTIDEATNTTTLELTLQEEVKAGVPFILQCGDYKAYSADAIDRYFLTPLPEEVSSAASEANGLIGTLDGLTLNKSGFGYIDNDGLKATTSAAFSIAGQRGYIDPSKVKAAEGTTDLVLTLEGGLINGIQTAQVAKATDKVNVYSVDGKLIKRNVKATEACKGLKKGVYIIGKHKVAVK